MKTMANILIGVAIAVVQAMSSFNTYEVFLSPTRIPGACAVTDANHFRNRSYTFRGRWGAGSRLTLRNGAVVALNIIGKPEWETSLVDQRSLALGGQAAVMLFFVADHVGGTGRFGTVLIARCEGNGLNVRFEAVGEGLVEPQFNADQELLVKRAVWSQNDAHCCPSGEAEERYRWNRSSGRFVQIRAAGSGDPR